MHIYARSIAAAMLLLAATAAQAQYAWIGPNGTRQYSDKPPPPETPASKILKSPGRMNTLSEAPSPAPAEGAAAPIGAKAEAPKGPPSVADREAAYKERQKTEAEAQQKAQQEAQQQQQKAAACASAREAQAQLASGMRMAKVDENGQRGYMNDAERAARTQRVNQALENCR